MLLLLLIASELVLAQCGGDIVAVQSKRDSRCRGHSPYGTYGPSLAMEVACFDEPSGRCMLTPPENCDRAFSGDLVDCQIVCENRGCNAAEPCASDKDACVFMSEHGTGLCVPRCVDDACPPGQIGVFMKTCAPAKADYAGSCPAPCNVCGLGNPAEISVDPQQTTVVIPLAKAPPEIHFNALLSRIPPTGPAEDVTVRAEWTVHDPAFGSFTAPGTFALSGVTGKTTVGAVFYAPGTDVPRTGAAEITVENATAP